jgi:hypothetical protein
MLFGFWRQVPFFHRSACIRGPQPDGPGACQVLVLTSPDVDREGAPLEPSTRDGLLTFLETVITAGPFESEPATVTTALILLEEYLAQSTVLDGQGSAEERKSSLSSSKLARACMHQAAEGSGDESSLQQAISMALLSLNHPRYNQGGGTQQHVREPELYTHCCTVVETIRDSGYSSETISRMSELLTLMIASSDGEHGSASGGPPGAFRSLLGQLGAGASVCAAPPPTSGRTEE